MLFNNQHIKLDRINYEEAFLLYTDGELSEEQNNAVEAFAALHPDLQEELDDLIATRLNNETVFFNDKESLFSKNHTVAVDESLLLYIDEELPINERTIIEHRISSDDYIKKQYELLRATKLNSKETIVYPYKRELYRNTQSSVRPLFLLRIAVAVILILSAAIFVWMGSDKATPVDAAQITTAPEKKTEEQRTAISNIPALEKNEKVNRKENKNVLATRIPEYSQEQTAHKRISTPSLTKKSSEHVLFLKQNKAAVLPDPKDRTLAAIEIQPGKDLQSEIDPANNPSQHIINKVAVTTGIPETYNNQKKANNETGVIYASQNSNDRQGSVRGFFRKATRFFERRTGINPVNEDDKLLIGVVAIKL
jgi:anti-sigma factor RsiW